MTSKINVSEIFYTIQGEGPSAGKPALFIRLFGCNLRCSFCDSDYTWVFSDRTLDDVKSRSTNEVKLKVYDKEEERQTYTIEELYQVIQDYILNKNCEFIVITGGEPMLQQDRLARLFTLFDYQELQRINVEIETNGTILPTQPKLIMTPQINFIVSPKLISSGNKFDRTLKPDVIRMYYQLGSNFKFVIRDMLDIHEVKRITDYFTLRKDFDMSRVWLMPEGQTHDEIAKNSKRVVELCKKYGYNYSHRIHIEIYGNKRGR